MLDPLKEPVIISPTKLPEQFWAQYSSLKHALESGMSMPVIYAFILGEKTNKQTWHFSYWNFYIL